MTHRKGSIVFGLVIGMLAALWSYEWISNPSKRLERAEQEQLVMTARRYLENKLQVSDIEIVDPLSPNRKVGKVYVYPRDPDWEVSGYYRREPDDRWHAYLMTLNADFTLMNLKVQDSDKVLIERSRDDAQLLVIP